jgi:hypothetical protein
MKPPKFKILTIAKYGLPLLLLLLSIKPILFTWNYFLAKIQFDIRDDKLKGYMFLYKAIHYNPSEFLLFKTDKNEMADSLVTLSAHRENLDFIRQFGRPPLDMSYFEKEYKDNFYFQYLKGKLNKKRNWQNLDKVSFDMLEDPALNPLTILIFEKLRNSFTQPFVENLVEFCHWKKNTELADYLVISFNLKDKFLNRRQLSNIPWKRSVALLQDYVGLQWARDSFNLGHNLLPISSFGNPGQFEKFWDFSDMAGGESFGKASFYLGLDMAGPRRLVRLMGFWVGQRKGKEPPRGGLWLKQPVRVFKGYYVFSFDYRTKTGKENPSFFLWKGIAERRLPPTKNRWHKVVFIIDNSRFRHYMMKPLIRMWGTGTMLVDNVFLGRIRHKDDLPPQENQTILMVYNLESEIAEGNQ